MASTDLSRGNGPGWITTRNIMNKGYSITPQGKSAFIGRGSGGTRAARALPPEKLKNEMHPGGMSGAALPLPG